MPVPMSLFDEIYARHGHRCPMSTLGGRIGYAADGRVAGPGRVAVYYANTCALDGVRVTIGCEDVRVLNDGRHALALVCESDGRGVLVALREEALDIAWQYRRVSEALERERSGLGPEDLAAREKAREQVLDEVLQQLRSVADSELLEISPIVLDPETLLEKQP